jgi:hypothetical protein
MRGKDIYFITFYMPGIIPGIIIRNKMKNRITSLRPPKGLSLFLQNDWIIRLRYNKNPIMMGRKSQSSLLKL